MGAKLSEGMRVKNTRGFQPIWVKKTGNKLGDLGKLSKGKYDKLSEHLGVRLSQFIGAKLSEQAGIKLSEGM